MKDNNIKEINDFSGDISKINNVSDLITYRKAMLSDDRNQEKIKKILEQRMSELLKSELPKINDIYTLIFYQMNTSYGSESQRLVDCRLSEIFETEVPKINNTKDIINLLGHFENHPRFAGICRKYIGIRIDQINKNNIPGWFTNYIENPDTIPDEFGLKKRFISKIEEVGGS